MKERVTITLDSETLRQVDALVGTNNIKNRSHAIESILSKSLGSNVPRTAVILAGGKGSRFGPISREIPKPLIPLHDKPLLLHSINLLKKYGITDIIISIGYKADKIKEFFGNGERFGVKISYVEEKESLGTAGALRLAAPRISGPFLVCNADDLMEIDIPHLFRFHKQRKGLATIVLTRVEDPSNYGVAMMNAEKIIAFVEKPKRENAPSSLINAGLYILEPEVLKMIPKGFAMLEKDVFPKLASEGKLYGYPYVGKWLDVGTMERYEQALDEWKDIE
ncbi:nucleotidyltransferase [Candidatus Woesearchaeota archaeon CG10_big_fil_rev_8_21_14_0_10_45_5]|nr:MAG: nucleotidyltransferase [Candidatus Woesearchaeota archaeon CG10_big_fil_rev_8_21_14_0_10_45_5]PIU30520.1 MAG: nucleotidyltransferase [Candidatus Woesearchaeota archaeon CG07_land_8_20_14_0_80_44_23]